MAIIVALFGIMLSNWVKQKTKESEKEVKTELEKIAQLKKEIETERGVVEKIKHEAEACLTKTETCLAKIEKNTEKSDELLNVMESKHISELSLEEKQELKEEVDETDKTKPMAKYTSTDWFLKALDAQEKNELDEACIYYKKAIELKPDYAPAYNNWGSALFDLGKIKEDEELFVQSIEKYKKAIELEPDFVLAYNGCGVSLYDLGKIKGDTTLYKEEIESLLLKAEDIKEGSGSYNLACLYSLLGDKNNALKWLDKDLQHNPNKRTRQSIENDDDFANIKDTPEFKYLLNKYFQKCEYKNLS